MLSESEKMLKESVLEACELDDERLQKLVDESEPHVFSERFEKNMEKVFRMYRRRCFMRKVTRYTAAAAVLVLVVTGGIFLTTGKSAEATTPGVNVLEWLKDYFSFEKGNSGKSEGVLFDESQIGYMPEGFELSEEEVSSSVAIYKYINDNNEFITLQVGMSKFILQQNNENIDEEVGMSLAGYEYTYIYEKVKQEHVLFWADDNELQYTLIGKQDKEIMMKIMESITYER
ncbi:MAG: DUF4367 domain-containing protein [Lachnospiraceae bacterium]|nr:DUF4367 domain-containing protein [Lachnospiraceae bacterium]